MADPLYYQDKPLIEHDKETIVRLFEDYVAMSRKQMDDQMARDRRQMLEAARSKHGIRNH